MWPHTTAYTPVPIFLSRPNLFQTKQTSQLRGSMSSSLLSSHNLFSSTSSSVSDSDNSIRRLTLVCFWSLNILFLLFLLRLLFSAVSVVSFFFFLIFLFLLASSSFSLKGNAVKICDFCLGLRLDRCFYAMKFEYSY